MCHRRARYLALACPPRTSVPASPERARSARARPQCPSEAGRGSAARPYCAAGASDYAKRVMNKERITHACASGFDQVIADLENLVRIPSVSADSFDQEQVERSARAVAELFAAAGLDSVDILRVSTEDGISGRPAVVGHKEGPKGAPHVLLYAHHDVQPPGDTSTWESEPFEPTIRGERMYGRGTGDDKAGVVAHLGALRAWGDDLPVSLTVFIEGEEEIGSPSFVTFLETYRERLAADVIIVADSSNWAVGTPSVTTSLRGVVSAEVSVKVAEHAVHSGMFGGPFLDAVTSMCRLIATLHDDDGAPAVQGLHSYDHAQVEYPEENLRAEAGLVDSLELSGRGSLASRLWTQPAITTIGMDVTSVEKSSNTAIPQCTAMLSLRVAPGQDPQEAAGALREHLLSHAPRGAEVEVKITETGPAYLAAEGTKGIEALRWALADAWDNEPKDIGVGGSIPFIGDLQRVFPEADVLVTGVEDPNTKAHSENESVHLGELQKVITAEALLLGRLGGVF